jgi:hypothetical protein
MKFLLVKALMGFGDRLEYLAMCIDFCKKNNVKLRVDWSDPIWGEEFTKYFSLTIPSFELDEVSSVSTYPSFWKGRLDEPLTNENFTRDNEVGIITLRDEDLVVASSCGLRTLFLDYRFFGDIFRVIDQRIVTAVRERQKKYNLKDKWCIHLRGTDRFKKPGMKERRFQELFIKLVGRGLLNHGGGCIVLSDDIHLIKMWKARDKSPILSNVMDTEGKGVHQSSPEKLGTTKYQINLELLIDFFTMASCKQIFSTSMDSRFAKMAQRLHPVISLIL